MKGQRARQLILTRVPTHPERERQLILSEAKDLQDNGRGAEGAASDLFNGS
jgi:hypothetical protein